MTIMKEFNKSIGSVLLKSFSVLAEIIYSKEASNADKISAINCLLEWNQKTNFVIEGDEVNDEE